MASIVCQVVGRSDRLSFIWSDGAASFEPYHLAGAERDALLTLAAQAREALARPHDDGAGPMLTRLGHQLYRAVFRVDAADGQAAQEIGRWLAGLQAQIESLEFLTDAPGRIPFNLLLDAAPAAGGVARWEQFWGCRFNLAAGRRTNPLRFAAPLAAPSALLMADARLLDEATADVRQRLESWTGERLIVDTAEQVAGQLRGRTPDVLVLLARVEGSALRLGGQPVAPADLRGWIGEAREGNPNPVVILGAIGGAGQGTAWEDWLAVATAELDGLVTNVVPLDAAGASAAVLAAAERFLQGRRPLGAALADARAALGAAGLALTAFCPPGLRIAEADTEVASNLPSQPLPEYPYCPLRPFGAEHRPLFFGREDDTLRLANLLDGADTAGVLLHGAPAAGKTSLIDAGLTPYLEQECIGYRLLCDRAAEESPTAEADDPALVLRPGPDLAGQIADALVSFCARPLSYVTPTGATVTVDLPAILAAQLGLPAPTAIQAPAAPRVPPEQAASAIAEPGHEPPPTPEERESGPGAGELWLALREEPARLGRLLDEVTRRLPYELLVVIDQGEELVTLVESETERERRRQALEMLSALAASPARCKVLLALRTEYYGQVAGLFPAAGRAGWRDYFLDELGPAAMVDAVLGPTSRDEVLYSDEVPHTKYGFAYEDGLGPQIVDEVIAEARAESCGPLALLQVVCALLYDRRVVQKRQTTLRSADLRDIGGVRGALGRFVAERINRLDLPRGAREGLRGLVMRLYSRHTDGRITRDLVPARQLKDAWKGPVPVEQAVNAAADQAGLFTIEQLLVAGQPGLYVGLADDSVARAGRQWQDDARRAVGGRSGVVDTLWIMIPLAMLAAALTFYFTRSYFASEMEEQKKAVKSFTEDVQEQVNDILRSARAPFYRGQLAHAERALAVGNALGARQALAVGAKEEQRGFEWDYLWGRANPERHDLEGHLGTVTAVSASADGKLVASASADGTVRIWNVAAGLPAAVVRAGKGPVNAVALAPDGKTVAAAGADKVVRLWDLSGLKDAFVTLDEEPQKLAGHTDAVQSLAFARDGQTLVSGGADKTVMVWDVKAGKPRHKLTDLEARVLTVALSPDGKTLAAGGTGSSVLVWAADSGKKSRALKTPFQSVAALAFAADGKTLAVGGTERQAGHEVGAVRFWDVEGGAPAKEPAATPYHGRGVLALAYLPGGKGIVSAGKDATIRLWDVASGAPAGRWVGHLGWVSGLAFAGDGTLVSGGYDQSVKLWDTAPTGGAQVLRGHADWVQAVAFGGGGKNALVLASGGKDGVVKLWDPVTGATRGDLGKQGGAVTSLAFDFARSRVLAVGTFDEQGEGLVKIWELTPKEKGGGYTGKELFTLKGHKGGVTSIAFSPRGDVLASGSADRTAILWDAKAGKKLHTLAGHQGEVRCVAFSHDGVALFTGGTDKTVHTWSVADGQAAAPPFLAGTDTVETIGVVLLQGEAADERALVIGGLDQLLSVWALGKSGFQPVGTSRATGQPITAMVRFRNSTFTAGLDGTVRVWGFELTGPSKSGEPSRIEMRERFTFTGHTAPVRALALSPDQSVLASVSDDGTIRLWRAAANRPVTLPKGGKAGAEK